MNLALRRLGTLTYRASLMTGVALVLPPLSVRAGESANEPPELVIIEGQRPQDYKPPELPSLGKLTEPLIDTPQTINVITEQLLKDRAATNLTDALRTVPGISIGAGEFRSLGNTPTIRGFVARTDIFMDGMRDFGSYYRDPFNFDGIEVLQGPSSVLFGRGSTGGVINQVSKLPMMSNFVTGTVIGGTDYTRRGVIDFNRVVPELGEGAAFRFTAMGHEQNVTGRNVIENSRWGVAPSLALGLGMPTRLTAAYFHMTANDIPDYGLPYLGANPAPVPRQTYYGFDSDFRKTTTDIGTLKAEHDFASAISVRNQLRYAYYTRDFRFTEPLINGQLTMPLPNIVVTRNVDPGKAHESMLWDQFDATLHFETGRLNHTVVIGAEGGREHVNVEYENVAGVSPAPLFSPDSHVPFNGTIFPRIKTDTTVTGYGLFAIDTIKFGERWEVMGGIRWDDFHTDYHDIRYSTVSTSYGTVIGGNDIERDDAKPSYRTALIYKPQTNGTVYFSYGTSFNSSADELSLVTSSRNFNIANAFLDPEENENFEVGTKWDLLDGRLFAAASLFQLDKKNARVPDPTNSAANVLAGDQRVRGADLQAIGHITENWQLTVGYTWLDGQTIKSTPGGPPVGSELQNTPEHAAGLWTTYRFGQFEIGGGGQYVASRVAQNVPPTKSVSGYWTFDAMGKYDISERLALQLNVINIFDKFYIDQLHFFHVVPGAGRTALLSLNFSY